MSRGDAPKSRARLLVKALLEYETNQGDRITNLGVNWAEDGGANLLVSATKQALFHFLKDIPEFKPTAKTRDDQVRKNIGESLTKHLNQFLEILDDHRTDQQKGVGDWTFTLRLWQRVELKNAEENILRNLVELDKLWDAKRSPQSATYRTNTNITNNSVIGTIENAENLEVNITPDRSEPSQPVPNPVKTKARLRGLDNLRAIPVWEGREVLLGELRQKLRDGLRVLAIMGQGGMGKSSLATKLLEAVGVNLQRRDLGEDCPYEGVVYYRVNVGTSFDDGVGQLLRDLGADVREGLVKPEEKIDQIISSLAGLRWLVVLDNLEDILLPAKDENAGRAISPEWGQLLNALVYRNHQSQVVITSREMPVDLGDIRGRKYSFDCKLVFFFLLEGIDQLAAVRVLQDYGMKDSEADLFWMAEQVKGNPLVLVFLGNNYTNNPGYLRNNPKFVTEEIKPILQTQLDRLPEQGKYLFMKMCALNIPIDIYSLTALRLYQNQKYRFKSSGSRSQMVKPTPKEISETEEIVNKLVASSLMRCGYDQHKREKVYEV